MSQKQNSQALQNLHRENLTNKATVERCVGIRGKSLYSLQGENYKILLETEKRGE